LESLGLPALTIWCHDARRDATTRATLSHAQVCPDPKVTGVLPLVYLHGGGIHVNIRLEQHKLCTLVMAGSVPTGARSSPPHADGDVEAFILMTGLADEIDAAIAEAVKGLRAYGYFWAEIGSRLGITRRPLSNAGDNAASPAMPHDKRRR